MRIRSIKPEFYRSEDIAALDLGTRLLFIGLWSYVDDNGVGRDIESLIVADLFALDEPTETLARVSRGLAQLSARGLIARYTVSGRRYLHITKWASHQKIDRPSTPRYPLPTCEDAVIEAPSRDTRETLAPGAVEQRNRGTEEQGSKEPSSAEPMESTRSSFLFEQFWDHYPRKVGRQDARRAWDKARRKVSPAVMQSAVERMASDPNLPEQQFIPHASTWLNRGGWDDAPYPPPSNGRPKASTTDERVNQGLSMAQRYAAQEAREEQQRLEIAQ